MYEFYLKGTPKLRSFTGFQKYHCGIFDAKRPILRHIYSIFSEMTLEFKVECHLGSLYSTVQ